MAWFGLLIPAATAALIVWRTQSPRPEQGPLATTVLVPAALALCCAAFMAFIFVAGARH